MNKKNYKSPQTATERAFAVVWQQLLETEKIGIYDNFFELGGHSYLAIKLVKRINSLGYDIKLKDIFNNQTIAKLANGWEEKQIKGRAGNVDSCHQQEEYLIPLQKEGDLPPVFVVHSLWAYVQLAALLGKNQPFYCLEGAKFDTVEEIASFYITQIKHIQPKGPYYLGGFCLHGYIALEIARQLAARGDEVGTLFLFETYSPAGIIPRLSWKYMKLSYNKLISWPSLNRKKYLKDEIRQTLKRLICVSVKFAVNRDLIKTYSGKIILAKPRLYDITYTGKVILFRSEIKEIWATDDHEMGWSTYFNGETDVFTLEGSHTDIFTGPGVIKLSKIIKRELENVRNYATSA